MWADMKKKYWVPEVLRHSIIKILTFYYTGIGMSCHIMLSLVEKDISFALLLPLITMWNPLNIRQHLLFSSLDFQMQMLPRFAPPSNCNRSHLDEGSGRVCFSRVYFVQLGHFPGISETGTLGCSGCRKIAEHISFLLCASKFIWLFFS